jgi:hypothetical protein
VSAHGLGLPVPMPGEVFDGERAVAIQSGADLVIKKAQTISLASLRFLVVVRLSQGRIENS